MTMTHIENQLKLEVQKIKDQFALINETGYKIEIEFRGRADSPEFELTYRVADNYGLGQVEGNDLWSVVHEFLRRHGWQEEHQVKAIAFQPEHTLLPAASEEMTAELDDEIPF